jgi:hypothetical protein
MKILPLSLLLSCTLCTLSTYAVDKTKACPYSKEGLTWPIVETSNHLRIEVIRSEENEQEWQHIRTIMQPLVHDLNLELYEDTNRLVFSVRRADNVSDEQWVNLLDRLVQYCRDIPNKARIYPETIIITDLNRIA